MIAYFLTCQNVIISGPQKKINEKSNQTLKV